MNRGGMADGEAIKAEIIEAEGEGRLVVIAVEPESTEATAQPTSGVPAKKPTGKGRSKRAQQPQTTLISKQK